MRSGTCRRYGMVAGLAAAAAVVAVIVGALAVTRDGDDRPQPIGPSPTPTETRADTTPETTPPLNLPANGRIASAEDVFARALEPCSITADYDPGADCVISAQDVDAAAGSGVLEEFPNDTDLAGEAAMTTPRSRALVEHRVVIDADGDRDPDCQIGINNGERAPTGPSACAQSLPRHHRHGYCSSSKTVVTRRSFRRDGTVMHDRTAPREGRP